MQENDYHGAVRFVDLRMLQRDVAKQHEGEIQEQAFVDAVTNPYTQSCKLLILISDARLNIMHPVVQATVMLV
jgi:hypothetical protein